MSGEYFRQRVTTEAKANSGHLELPTSLWPTKDHLRSLDEEVLEAGNKTRLRHKKFAHKLKSPGFLVAVQQ